MPRSSPMSSHTSRSSRTSHSSAASTSCSSSSSASSSASSSPCKTFHLPRSSVFIETLSSTALAQPDEWRCRYKTGKCHYPRALKTNKKSGTDALLLLCERHRRLQNKTKKRSDTKYKADRAMLRVVKRLHPDLVLHPPSSCTSLTSSSAAALTKDPPPTPFSASELDMLAFYLL
ncbi:Aste57867_15416 [Aphanomyces stellatus]|uniref:Aste57867_15416 protein n=1 Tax=Aphanomyces stellatus TaxID=120398 RepID=A0A485L4X8_9STRA|nr:hypothetical protein As57867_015360 [Aphanomyces stellatus]VFT92218.1 Aste57867_15416 [Aphanomyces stellatus]